MSEEHTGAVPLPADHTPGEATATPLHGAGTAIPLHGAGTAIPLHGAGIAIPLHGAATLVPLHGEIDLLTVPALSQRLDALTAHPRPDLVLDLRPVVFIDCAGLGVLCRTRNRALARRGRLRLVADSPAFLRTLRTAGLRNVFEVLPGLPRTWLPGTHESF
ncbi:STAS domain-containing protein [Streptomyces sp. NPDC005728]|uniref:STAS domain-containing protein n=1 Tax=Streptomyces sp. NPDC005728 TaxID=3157054 RepID=UPI0033F55797